MFLEGVVADADRLLTVAREAMEELPADDPERPRLHEAAALLARLLMQDIERREDGARLKQGVSPDRVVSVHDPEMRHGRKSAKRRFDGHKAAIAVDPESQLITAADVLPGNAPDHEQALELVEQAEANAGVVVEETVGDCAYGDGETRQTFAEAGRKLVAKVASRRGPGPLPERGLPDRSGVDELHLPRRARDAGRWCRSARASATAHRASPCARFASTPPSATHARCGPRACGRARAKGGW